MTCILMAQFCKIHDIEAIKYLHTEKKKKELHLSLNVADNELKLNPRFLTSYLKLWGEILDGKTQLQKPNTSRHNDHSIAQPMTV